MTTEAATRRQLIESAMDELVSASVCLRQTVAAWRNCVPTPRPKRLYVTRRLVLSANLDHRADVLGAITYQVCRAVGRRGHEPPILLTRGAWLHLLEQQAHTPRRLARALARIDSYTKWLTNRHEGLQRAYEHFKVSQAPWQELLDIRISGIELAQEYLRDQQENEK